ncbi:MAG: hypothetical protein PF638_03100 [Candidatus Delongbacteria bacterium]|jgi:putative transposase|nr:hypothetical protein [Candidatus Delongbacteria bacterium]
MFKRSIERKSNRLNSYNYDKEGYYFITINTEDMEHKFGKVENGKMVLSKIGNIANDIWYTIPDYHKNIILDEFIIMPNHIHGIIIVENANITVNDKNGGCNVNGVCNVNGDCNVNWGRIPATPTVGDAGMHPQSRSNMHPQNRSQMQPDDRSKMILSKTIHAYKSVITKEVREKLNNKYFKWQRSFHDRIIRTEKQLFAVRQYIINNPMKW